MASWIGVDTPDADERWWAHLRRSEESESPFHATASYVRSRRIYVDSVWSLCEDHGPQETTAHVATRYYDSCMQREPAGGELLDAFTLDELRVACVLVAAKFEEHDADLAGKGFFAGLVEYAAAGPGWYGAAHASHRALESPVGGRRGVAATGPEKNCQT